MGSCMWCVEWLRFQWPSVTPNYCYPSKFVILHHLSYVSWASSHYSVWGALFYWATVCMHLMSNTDTCCCVDVDSSIWTWVQKPVHLCDAALSLTWCGDESFLKHCSYTRVRWGVVCVEESSSLSNNNDRVEILHWMNVEWLCFLFTLMSLACIKYSIELVCVTVFIDGWCADDVPVLCCTWTWLLGH